MRASIERSHMTDEQLTKALSRYLLAAGLHEAMMRQLRKDDDNDHKHEEEAPELYIRQIIAKMGKSFQSVMKRLTNALDKWFAKQFNRGIFTQRDPQGIVLTQEQKDELRSLIESFFRSSIGMQLQVPEKTLRKWKRAGIELPNDVFLSPLSDSFMAGRFSSNLNNNQNYDALKTLLSKRPKSRLDEFAFEAAKQNAAKYISGFGRKIADIADEVLAENHKVAVNDVIQQFFGGDLKHTLYNEERLTPAQTDKLLSTSKEVRNWRELSTELKNRFKGEDVGRNWDRVTVSEVRFSTNWGRLMNIQVEGGGDPDKIEVYYHVQTTACKYCKKLYLNEDGTPKIFKLSEILKNVQDTGGMQIGLKPGLIGQDGGWVPNLISHPYCHCYMVRVIEGYTMPKGGNEVDRKTTGTSSNEE